MAALTVDTGGWAACCGHGPSSPSALEQGSPLGRASLGVALAGGEGGLVATAAAGRRCVPMEVDSAAQEPSVPAAVRVLQQARATATASAWYAPALPMVVVGMGRGAY
jgi:hypothetical protein